MVFITTISVSIIGERLGELQQKMIKSIQCVHKKRRVCNQEKLFYTSDYVIADGLVVTLDYIHHGCNYGGFRLKSVLLASEVLLLWGDWVTDEDALVMSIETVKGKQWKISNTIILTSTLK